MAYNIYSSAIPGYLDNRLEIYLLARRLRKGISFHGDPPIVWGFYVVAHEISNRLLESIGQGFGPLHRRIDKKEEESLASGYAD